MSGGESCLGEEVVAPYTLAPAFSTMTRSMTYLFGTYFDADGNELSPRFDQDWLRRLSVAMLS